MEAARCPDLTSLKLTQDEGLTKEEVRRGGHELPRPEITHTRTSTSTRTRT